MIKTPTADPVIVSDYAFRKRLPWLEKPSGQTRHTSIPSTFNQTNRHPGKHTTVARTISATYVVPVNNATVAAVLGLKNNDHVPTDEIRLSNLDTGAFASKELLTSSRPPTPRSVSRKTERSAADDPNATPSTSKTNSKTHDIDSMTQDVTTCKDTKRIIWSEDQPVEPEPSGHSSNRVLQGVAPGPQHDLPEGDKSNAKAENQLVLGNPPNTCVLQGTQSCEPDQAVDLDDRQVQINQAVAGFRLLLREALLAANEAHKLAAANDISAILDGATAALDDIDPFVDPTDILPYTRRQSGPHHFPRPEVETYTSTSTSSSLDDESDQSFVSLPSAQDLPERLDSSLPEEATPKNDLALTHAYPDHSRRPSYDGHFRPEGLSRAPTAGSAVRDFAIMPARSPNLKHRIRSIRQGNAEKTPHSSDSSSRNDERARVSPRSHVHRSHAVGEGEPDPRQMKFKRSLTSQSQKRARIDSHHPIQRLNPNLNLSLKHPRRNHISLREGQGFSLGRSHKRRPIAREWSALRKRITAAIACFNTVFIGLIVGIYAGEVPRIQYILADLSHHVILGNVMLFIGLALVTILFWPLPLLHGRKPYTILAFAVMLPLQFPQALSVAGYRNPNDALSQCGLLIPRFFTGLAMGFANINQLPTLMDLFGASMMHERPHGEIVVYDDVRRQGGGLAIWLGIWSFCFIGSLSIGFCVGACIIASLSPDWGFYIVSILLAFFLMVNVIAPETRRAPYRRSITHFFDDDDKMHRRIARGEVKLHISNDGPKWWFDEVWAGLTLSARMARQPGFFVLMVYTAWIYCQVVVVVLLLGALLSRDYLWRPQFVGLAALSLTLGALCATPLTKASLFSRARYKPPRTDSMTMRPPRLTWTSHLVRRCLFTFMLPLAGLAYTLASSGEKVQWTVPVIFAGCIGFLSTLAMAECVGLMMESFDTCDLQPGVNQRHRLQSMASVTRRRRTNYSAFPRVCAGFFSAQSLGFLLAAAGTGVSGRVTRALGAQTTTAIVASILLVLTVFLMLVLLRFKSVQVIPTSISGSFHDTGKSTTDNNVFSHDPDWVPVVIGNPSGKMRRVNLLELGALSRWTEIRKLNDLILQ